MGAARGVGRCAGRRDRSSWPPWPWTWRAWRASSRREHRPRWQTLQDWSTTPYCRPYCGRPSSCHHRPVLRTGHRRDPLSDRSPWKPNRPRPRRQWQHSASHLAPLTPSATQSRVLQVCHRASSRCSLRYCRPAWHEWRRAGRRRRRSRGPRVVWLRSPRPA